MLDTSKDTKRSTTDETTTSTTGQDGGMEELQDKPVSTEAGCPDPNNCTKP